MDLGKKYDCEVLFSTAIKAVLKILEHHDIAVCMVGPVAYNYYNIPDGIHDIEMCVSDEIVEKASTILQETGLVKKVPFTQVDHDNEFMIDFPRVTTTEWTPEVVSFVILPASACGLQPLGKNSFRPVDYWTSNSILSDELQGAIDAEDIKNMRFPRLPPFFTGLAKRYLETPERNFLAASGAEHLVDGLNISHEWCDKHLPPDTAETAFVRKLVAGRKGRIDYWQDHTVTTFLADEEQARRASKIPGYDEDIP